MEVLDQQAQQRFRLLRSRGLQRCFQVVRDGAELSVVGRRGRIVVQLIRQLVVLVGERVELGVQRGDAAVEALGVEVARLERAGVALDRPLGSPYPGRDAGAACFDLVTFAVVKHAGYSFDGAPARSYAAGFGKIENGQHRWRVFLMLHGGWTHPSQTVIDRMFPPTGDSWDVGGLGRDPLATLRDTPEIFDHSGSLDTCGFSL